MLDDLLASLTETERDELEEWRIKDDYFGSGKMYKVMLAFAISLSEARNENARLQARVQEAEATLFADAEVDIGPECIECGTKLDEDGYCGICGKLRLG